MSGDGNRPSSASSERLRSILSPRLGIGKPKRSSGESERASSDRQRTMSSNSNQQDAEVARRSSTSSQREQGESSAVAPQSRHKRGLSWASRHKRTTSSVSQASKDGSQQPHIASNHAEAHTEKALPKKPAKTRPIITTEIANPLEESLPYTTKFFAAAALVTAVAARYIHPLLAYMIAAASPFVLRSQLQTASRDAAWRLSEQRAAKERAEEEDAQTESVEWMNSILRTVWPLITQDYFVPFIDLLEDALMMQVPGIVHSCRVEDLDQGSVPLVVQSFTLLDPSDDAFLADKNGDVHEVHNADDKSDDKVEVDTGDYVNLEVSFAYRSPAARRQKTKSNRADATMTDEDREALQATSADGDLPVDQIHMLIYMAIGLQKIAAVEMPVWCEVLGIEGKMRLRIQLVPIAPFVGHVAFTFVGMPKIEMSAKPLGKRMVIDAMHLPLISSYVLHSVESVVKGFINPKSYTVDVASLVDANDGPRNVYSLGVIMLVIHQAFELPAADTNGHSDPFVSVSFAKAGKPLFTSRVLLRTREPVWHEMAILLVSPDEVRDHEQLRLTVFDADRFSVDDPLGKIDISIDKLINRALGFEHRPSEASLFETQTERLHAMRRGKMAEGKLRYSVGFFRLSKPLQAERTAGKVQMLQAAAERHKGEDDFTMPERTHASGAEQNESMREAEIANEQDLDKYRTPFDRFMTKLGVDTDRDLLLQRQERKLRIQKLRGMMEGEAQATVGPPDMQWLSGILAFHIHSIDGLGFEPPQRSYTNSKRLNQKPRYSEDADPLGEGASKMPNSYVTVIINDEPVFRSRTKTLNPRPYINAGSERFVADLTRARVDFVVRDQRQRESDAILGIVGLSLQDVLKDECRVTQWYTISGGLGFGKIRISLLWRSAEVNIPKQLRGWNVGVLEIAKCSVGGISSSEHRAAFDKRDAHLLFETVGGSAESSSTQPFDEYESGEGRDAKFGLNWPLSTSIRIPVRQRYPNFLYIHVRLDSRVPGRSHRFAVAVVPLVWLVDDEETKRRVPLYASGSGNWQHFEQDIMHAFSELSSDLSSKHGENRRLLPILEDLCDTEKINVDDNQGNIDKDGETLQRIGHLDIILYFHAGIASEHKKRTPGDNELRVAYESWLTLVDSGQRPKPKMLSAAHRKRLSNAGLEAGGTTDDDRVGAEPVSQGQPEAEGNGIVPENVERDGNVSSEFSGEEPGLDDSASELDANDEDGLIDADGPEGRRARIRTLHRQQRGAAQIKGYRTLEWLKTNAEDSLGKMRTKASRSQQKRLSKMESEGVSHF